jgi:hypothetical protein
LNKVLSLFAVAAFALSFSTAVDAATKKKGELAANPAATAGMHQPKKVVPQKSLRTNCGGANKMTSGGAFAAGDNKQPAKAEGSGTVSGSGKQAGPPPVSIKLEEVSSRKTKTTPAKKD